MILKECFTDAFITSHAGDNIDKKKYTHNQIKRLDTKLLLVY